ncbi:MAG: hypothetical protein HFH85_05055 [Lachnospiraceae bacterium]|jgi:beta-lactamase regulating signal transducer with metallopeptidase domain|nr:hypothetical protein [Lachnospiraceae bacterium]
MNTILKIFLSMSFSGALLILVLLFGKRFLKDKISRQWQYYIWLVVILRLLLPFGPETNLLGVTCQALEGVMNQASFPRQQFLPDVPEAVSVPGADLVRDGESSNRLEENLTAVHPLREAGELLTSYIWLIWLVVSLVLLVRKVTIYQSFVRYIRDGLTPVSDMEMLDRLSVIAEGEGVKSPVELGVNPLISSPMLIGFFRPCIVLPASEYREEDFRYIVLHELTHYKRRDMFYKWLVQVTVCLHWFNPLVHLMSREITKACEFSCDEAVLAKTGDGSARDYGKTLLDAMAAVGKHMETPGAVTLSENKQLLKERLGAIMVYQKRSRTVRMAAAALTLGVVFGAAFLGIYPVAAAGVPDSADTEKVSSSQSDHMPPGNAGQGSFSSGNYDYPRKEGILMYKQGMGEAHHQSALFHELDRDEECDKLEEEWEKEWEEAQIAEYGAAGVIMDGKNYYYQGQLVNIFLDVRADKSFYTLDLNPAGCVNIRIIRDADDKISGVSYMTDAEAARLFEDNAGEEDITGDDADGADAEEADENSDDWKEDAGGRTWYPQVIPVDFGSIKDGDVVWLGEYTLSEGDRIWYAVSAETGNGMQVGFAESGDTLLNTVYYAVQNQRQTGENLECIASITLKFPAKPGTYQLFLRATEGDLGNVKGSVSIGYVADAVYY